ncbi:MAG: hypothetical protein ABI307_03040 [Mycobacterium sp.]
MTQRNAGADRRATRVRVLTYGVLPGLVLLLAMVAGALRFYDSSTRNMDLARAKYVRAATDSVTVMLSYQSNTVDQDMAAAERLLTSGFRESFAERVRAQIAPEAKARRVTAVADVRAAASVSATPNQAVVLMFVDRTISIGAEDPIDVSSSFRVTLDKVDGRWLIEDFEPV